MDSICLKRSNDDFTRAIPVIVLSSKEEPAMKQLAFESGANDYMVKLPHRIELLARVRLHSEAYIHELQRLRTYRALEASQRELTEKNCELEVLNQKLEEATRFKSVFFANVSHEIRTPLIGVLGMAEMLSDTPLSVHQRELIEVIRTSGDTLLHIINDILDLSKIESGKLELESIPFVLRDVVDQVMDLLGPMAFGKGLEISAWIGPRLSGMVLGDITRVRQILLNLLNNAIKFTEAGEIYLKIEPSEESNDLLHFCVQDTGVGIPAEKLNRLFRSFSQVDESTNRRFGGTGLGLSICQNLTALMGGKIWVESRIGEGTQFHFLITLPAVAVESIERSDEDLHGKRMGARVKNSQLLRLLACWAEELGLDFIIENEEVEDAALVDFLIVDADHCQPRIPEAAPKTLLLTRSRNISGLAARYPNATVLPLPLKKRRFLQAMGVLAEGEETSGSPRSVETADPELSALNILVVDDNIINRRVCIAQLQKLGVWKITEAGDGREAVVAAQTQSFDLILMDVQMPETDGLEATRQIRQLLPLSEQPRIVGLTANAFTEERERCLEAGMDDKLTKPLRVEDLKAEMETTCKMAFPRDALPSPGADLPLCDEEKLSELSGVEGLDDFVIELIQLFVDQAEQLASQLPDLAKHPEILLSEAHKLKGAAGYVGAARAAFHCGLVEAGISSSPFRIDPNDVLNLQKSLKDSVEEYRNRLSQVMVGKGAS